MANTNYESEGQRFESFRARHAIALKSLGFVGATRWAKFFRERKRYGSGGTAMSDAASERPSFSPGLLCLRMFRPTLHRTERPTRERTLPRAPLPRRILESQRAR